MDLENDIEMVVRALTNEHLHVRIEHGDFDMEDEAAHLENSALILLDRASSGRGHQVRGRTSPCERRARRVRAERRYPDDDSAAGTLFGCVRCSYS